MNLYELLQLFIITHLWLNMRLECTGIFFNYTSEHDHLSIHKLAMLKLYDSRIMSFVLAEAKKKRRKPGLQGTGDKKLLVQQDSLHV